MAYVTDVREVARGGVVEIILDGEYALRVRARDYARMPVGAGDEIDEADYVERMGAIQANYAYERALDALDRAAKTELELRRKLARAGFVKPAIDAAIERLAAARLVNDADIADRLVKFASERQGVYAIKRKLRARGVSAPDAEEALESVTEDEQLKACRAQAASIIKRYAALPARESRAKLAQALARRGFSWDTINSALSADEYDDEY